ncbi:phospholipase D-like domain-containing protein [Methylosinus sp. RM1]|uniref:phospholipase D-like domain-containing protein n=1 Tax=Methylosinus sp. RM1 TaxID=2583817 RepID=UPI00140E6AEC|nr:phospholipase D-like domain-containing protein [Methylosinus sp. RM1]
MKRMILAALATFSVPSQPGGLLSQEPLAVGVRVFYGPRPGFEDLDLRLIGGAKKSIDMAAYVLTDRAVISALGAAAMRGVRVRIYIDGEERGGLSPAIEAIAAARNMQIKRKGRSRDPMHLKSYQVDGRMLRSGSANFSVSGAEFQDNDLILIESPAAVAQFEETFERLWTRSDNQKIGMR